MPVDEAKRKRRAFSVAEYKEAFPNGVIGDPYTMAWPSLGAETDLLVTFWGSVQMRAPSRLMALSFCNDLVWFDLGLVKTL